MEGISVGLPFICFPFNVSNFYMAEVLAQKGVATALDIREPDYHLLYTTFKNALEIHLSRSILQLIRIILHQESPRFPFAVKPRPTLFCMYFFMLIGKRIFGPIYFLNLDTWKEKFRPFWGQLSQQLSTPWQSLKVLRKCLTPFQYSNFHFRSRCMLSEKSLNHCFSLKNWMNYKNEFPN